MRSANLFGPLKGLCPHKALIGLTQASGLAGGFDLLIFRKRSIHPYVSGSAHASIAICTLNCSRQTGSNSLEPLAGHLLLKFESLNLLEMYNEH